MLKEFSRLPTMQGKTRCLVMVFALGLMWGGSFPCVELALTGFGPVTIAAARVSLGAAVLAAFSVIRGQEIRFLTTTKNEILWPYCLGIGLTSLALPWLLLNWGQIHVTSGFAGLTMATIPLMILPMAHFLTRNDRLAPMKTIGILIGFAGVCVLFGLGTITGPTSNNVEILARFACLGAAFGYAAGSILIARRPNVPRLAFGAVNLLVGSIALMPAALWIEGIPTAWPGVPAVFGVAFLGLGSTALGTLILLQVIRDAGASYLSLVNYQVPVWAVFFGTVFLGETLPPQFLVALALILLGLYFSSRDRLPSGS